jgi:ligand-binding sensor domain-containing protein
MSTLLRISSLVVFLWACAEENEDLLKPVQENQFTYFSQSDGLVDDDVTALFEDKEGNIWIGTAEGISVYDGNSFKTHTSDDGLLVGPIISIGQNSNGDIWAGSYAAYSVFNGNSWESEYSLGISSMYLDKNNTFWIGTFGVGLIQWTKNGQLTTFSSSQCDLCNYYTSIVEDDAGNIWCSTFEGAIRFKDGRGTLFDSSKGMNNFLSSCTTDNWGNVWFGSLEGTKLDRINDSKQSGVNLPTGNTAVTGLATKDNVVYISTDGAGLLYYDGVVVREIVTPQKDYNLLSILADSKGQLWIGTSGNGLMLLQLKDNI